MESKLNPEFLMSSSKAAVLNIPRWFSLAVFLLPLWTMMPENLSIRKHLRSVILLKISVIFLPVLALALKWSIPRLVA